MRLLVKTTIYFLGISLVVFGVGFFTTFYVLKSDLDRETDFFIWEQMKFIEEGLKKGVDAEQIANYKIHIEELEGEYEKQRPVFVDTLMEHRWIKRLEPHRKMTAIRQVGDQYYRIVITDVIIEEDDIFEGTFFSLATLFILLAVVLVASSLLVSKILLRPFETTLERIENFKIQENKAFEPVKSKIKEFNVLNSFIKSMTDKIRHDYKTLKEFSENASHEMQTPLAIAKGKMELLLESPNLDDGQAKLVGSAFDAVGKLSKLGRTLALLTKIENQEFAKKEELDFTLLLEDSIYNFKELTELKNITVSKNLAPDVRLFINPMEVNIVISNLLQNAIRHNIENGKIDIALDANSLVIKNTGEVPTLPLEQMFERFKKNNQSQNSFGLGLSIVKKICDQNHYGVHYFFRNGLHELQINFVKPE
ncbi:HAMP domain-containing sensor histidine kinase [Flammeovirgaceae bacterium SG7u.111]|nr:HAMP domain-containing sensor histidine kinase [Flammeovirgaceae bacterium SG7u.132]WPO34781.1 HAMP domain-containing sensor histidine kinase [Flammeovirgaceae bacterium SG7u.111]